MKKLLFTLGVTFLSIFAGVDLQAQTNSNHVWVDGYYKSDGTYVEGHYRTAPNNTINDNFSTYPNYNPYTGKQGTISPSPTLFYPNKRLSSYNLQLTYPLSPPKIN